MTRLKFALRSLAIAERKNDELRKSNEALHDAAEFSERVALKNAEAVTANPKGCLMKHECPLGSCDPKDCQRSILKFARLMVEEEMDG